MELIILLTLLILGYVFGQFAEKMHYRSILRREASLHRILIIPTKFPPEDAATGGSRLVTGSVVISVDYFKRFVAGLRSLIGGRIKSYESLLDRGRREAILRMKDQARRKGANMVINVKFETSSISKGAKDRIGSIEVLAYGTALIDHPNSAGL